MRSCACVAACGGMLLWLVVCGSGHSARAAAAASETKADEKWTMLPVEGVATARHECGLVSVGGTLYLVGGRGMRPVEALDLEKKNWVELMAAPMEIHHLQPVAYQGRVYIVTALTGGYPGERPLTNVQSFDPATGRWERGRSIPPERRRGAAGVVVHGEWIYVIGGIRDGHRGGYVAWADRYNPTTDVWEVLPDAPRPRDHFAAAVVRDEIVAAGGRTTSQATGKVFDLTVGEVDVFDTVTKQWRTLPEPIPTPRAGTAAVALGNEVWVIGGESGSQAEAHREVEAVDVQTGAWRKLPELSVGRHGMGACVIDGVIYVAAGCGQRGGRPELNSVERIKAAKQ